VRVAAAKKARESGEPVLTDEEKLSLMSTEQSLTASREPRLPSSMTGLENFTLSDSSDSSEDPRGPALDPDALFNLPRGDADHDDDEESLDPRDRR